MSLAALVDCRATVWALVRLMATGPASGTGSVLSASPPPPPQALRPATTAAKVVKTSRFRMLFPSDVGCLAAAGANSSFCRKLCIGSCPSGIA